MDSNIFHNLAITEEILDLLPVSIFVKDAQSRFQIMNKACEESWGIPLSALQGTDGSHFFSAEQMHRFLEKDQAVFSNRVTVEFEESFWSAKFDSNRIGLTTKKPIYDACNQPAFLVCITKDITDIKTAMRDILQAETELQAAATVEREMASQNSRLSQEITKRNIDLSALTAHVQKISEEEKASLARELHDELGSILVGLNMKFERLSEKLVAADLLQDVSDIQKLLSEACAIKANVINQLYPTILENFGLNAALEWLIGEYAKNTGTEVKLILPQHELVIDHPVSLAAYRIAQECLTNIAKHAQASKVGIEVKVCDGLLHVVITDNGKGLPVGENSAGHGIFGMVERARFLGGSMEISNEHGIGTTAHLILPAAIFPEKIPTKSNQSYPACSSLLAAAVKKPNRATSHLQKGVSVVARKSKKIN